MRRALVTLAVAAVCLPSTVASAQARAEPPAAAEETVVGTAGAPVVEPAALRVKRRSAGTTCTQPAAGTYDCLRPATAPAKSGMAATAIPNLPSFCHTADMAADRTRACQTDRYERVMTTLRNGVPVVTGGMDLRVTHLGETSTTTGIWTYWFEATASNAWGAAVAGTTIIANAILANHCTLRSESFPDNASLLPEGVTVSGSASIVTTVTQGVGNCTAAWVFWLSSPNYPLGNSGFEQLTDIRCDRATQGVSTTGCVVPWGEAVLAMHVLAAQESGLPGGREGDPLIRNEDPALRDINRALACGDAPSVPGWACDEYPPATSRQGLAAGGTRRTTRGGCMFLQLPRNVTGPTGVSVCMILAGESSGQGGLHTQFFRRWRVIEGDPWRVGVIA